MYLNASSSSSNQMLTKQTQFRAFPQTLTLHYENDFTPTPLLQRKTTLISEIWTTSTESLSWKVPRVLKRHQKLLSEKSRLWKVWMHLSSTRNPTRRTQAQIRDLTEPWLWCYRIAHKDEESKRDTRRNTLTTVTIAGLN